MSSSSDKDKTREELLTELEALRAELARARGDRRTSGELHAEAFFDNFHTACLELEPTLEGLNPFRNTVTVFQKLLENFPNGSVNIFDRNLRYLFAAGQGLSEAGLFAEKLVGKSLFELYEPEDAEHAAAHYRLALEGQSVSFELPFHHRLYSLNAAPLKDRSGNVYALIAVAQDVTARKQAEAVIEDRERRLSMIFESVADSLFLLSVEPNECYRFVSVNEAFLAATGFTKEQVIGRAVEEVLPETFHDSVKEKYREAIRTNRPVRWEHVAQRPAGRRVGEVVITPMRDDAGGRLYLLGGVHDITERAEAAETLRAMEQRAITEYEHLLFRLTHLAETFGTARELLTIFRALRDFAVASLPCIGIFISLYDAARDERTARYAWGDEQEIDVSQLPPMPITAQGPNSRAVRTSRAAS